MKKLIPIIALFSFALPSCVVETPTYTHRPSYALGYGYSNSYVAPQYYSTYRYTPYPPYRYNSTITVYPHREVIVPRSW